MLRHLAATLVLSACASLSSAQLARFTSVEEVDNPPGSPFPEPFDWSFTPSTISGTGSTGGGLGDMDVSIIPTPGLVQLLFQGNASHNLNEGRTLIAGAATLTLARASRFAITQSASSPIFLTPVTGVITNNMLSAGTYTIRFGVASGPFLGDLPWRGTANNRIDLFPGPALPVRCDPPTINPRDHDIPVTVFANAIDSTTFAEGPINVTVSGDGVLVRSVRRDSATRLTLRLSVAATATPSIRTLTITDSSGVSITSEPILGIATLFGTQQGEFFGQDARGIGDINGDGFDDVLISALTHDSLGLTDNGEVRLYLGGPTGLSPQPVWRYAGTADNFQLGRHIARPGDINNDGWIDLAITAADRVNPGATERGRVLIFLGSPMGFGAVPSQILSASATGLDRFGLDADMSGDFNADGFADLLTGASLFDMGGTNTGSAYLYLGSSQGTLTLARTWQPIVQADARVGRFVGFINADGDSYSDAVVSAILEDRTVSGTTYTNMGRAYLYRGGFTLPTTPVWTSPNILRQEARFGHNITELGDVNGDGRSDLAIASVPPSVNTQAEVHVYFCTPTGLPPAASQILARPAPTDDFAVLLAGPGDMNGDGFAEMLVSATTANAGGLALSGEALLYLGGPAGFNPTPARRYPGPHANARWGQTVAGAGDVNADGLMDAIIGSENVIAGTNGTSQVVGAASLILGSGRCDPIDFNNDGSLFDPQDIIAFLSVYSEGPCLPAGSVCNDIDFNNDASTFDPQDIASFLSVYSEGPCL